MESIEDQVKDEVEQLHQFFEDWFTGRLEQSEAAFSRFADVTARDFHLISPSGQMIDRDRASAWIWEIYNQRQQARLWVDKVAIASVRPGVIIATYEEWQRNPTPGFITTAPWPNAVGVISSPRFDEYPDNLSQPSPRFPELT